jgi:hypothetical protein
MRPALVLAWSLGGCSAYSFEDRSDAAPGLDTPEPPPDTDPDDTDSLDSGLLAEEPTWYAIDLAFAIDSTTAPPGTLVLDTAVLEVSVRARNETPLCTLQVPVIAADAAPPGELPPNLFGWWTLSLEAGDPEDEATPCPAWPARTWTLGVGAYDPRLDPQVASLGMLGYDLYGLYLQEAADAPLYVIGIAATPAMSSGEQDLTVDAAPLPDEVYAAQSLVLMSLDRG